MSDLICSIEKIFEVDQRGYIYNIPDYQRGYKWSNQQIIQLLDDINNFDNQNSEDQFYCLQNITIVEASDKLNVVDGQQRLTTLSLLLSYLGETDKVKGKLKYSVREESEAFLHEVISNNDNIHKNIKDAKDFDSFLRSNLNKDYDFQDIFFMFNAFKSFDSWFKEKSLNKDGFKEKLLKKVKLIVNRVKNVKEVELFMNLNAGCVHLDGADLIRAILVTRVAKEEMEVFDSENTQDVVRLNERRIRIGWELDEINNWWSRNDVKNYFSRFISINKSAEESISFNENINPINLLYKLWAEQTSENNKYMKLSIFEVETSLNLYASIIRLHRTLKDWFEDRKIYHFLGYLFTFGRDNFKLIIDKWFEKGSTRKEFTTFLIELVKKSAFGNDGDNSGLEFYIGKIKDFDSQYPTNWYKEQSLAKILILLDIIELSDTKEKGNPYPFLKPIFFSLVSEDKEHVYPCMPKELSDLKKLKLDNQLDQLNSYIERINANEDDLIDLIDKTQEEWDNLEEYEVNNLLNEVRHNIHQKRPINSIGNLVLLHSRINRGFGNNYFDSKRSEVIQNTENGLYVRQHTLKVFVKGDKSGDLNSWCMDDIRDNAQKIAERIQFFFNSVKEDRS